MTFTLATIAVALYALWVRRRVRAIRDIPEVMRVLWAAHDPQLRMIYPRKRAVARLWLDSNLPGERLVAAAFAAERAGLVEIVAGYVSISPHLVGRFWSDAGPGEDWWVHEQGGRWLDPEPAPWLSSFVNLSRVGS